MAGWQALNVPADELTLDHCLPTGQTFRWHQDCPGHYTGVLGNRLVQMRQTVADCEYRVLARGEGADPATDDAVIRDYFNLCHTHVGEDEASDYVRLAQLSQQWTLACRRYAHICKHIQGARMLRQPPLECLMQFICSSNNHISRIHGMVQRLCEAYGTQLSAPSAQTDLPTQQSKIKPDFGTGQDQAMDAHLRASSQDCKQEVTSGDIERPGDSMAVVDSSNGDVSCVASEQHTSSLSSHHPPSSTHQSRSKQRKKRPRAPAARTDAAAVTAGLLDTEGPPPVELQSPSPSGGPKPESHFIFPTLDQLSHATEEDLRAAGFGYRAKYIVGTVEALRSKEMGGEAWLTSLRTKSYREAATSLAELPGVGPKVAACTCLFSLDKHEAIPVDTHVWTIATRYYGVRSKSLTLKVHSEVQEAFVKRFGPYAGWAHNTLFISELAQYKTRIPAFKD